MQVAVKFYQKHFSNETTKEAYLEACKWVAQNVMNKEVEVGETTWSIKKVSKGEDLPTFKLELFCMIDETQATKSFCERCKEMHKAFFINEDFNCSRCNMITYRKELDSRLEIKKQFRKERIKFVTGNF